MTTAAESFVPGLMHAFAAERPGMRLTLAVGNRDQVFAGCSAMLPTSRSRAARRRTTG